MNARCPFCDHGQFVDLTLGNKCPVTGREHPLSTHIVTDLATSPTRDGLRNYQYWIWEETRGQWEIVTVL